MPPHADGGDDPVPDPDLWELTKALMQMWAGENVPGAVSAGLPGHGGAGPRGLETSVTVPLLLGLLLGVLLGLALGLLSLSSRVAASRDPSGVDPEAPRPSQW